VCVCVAEGGWRPGLRVEGSNRGGEAIP